MTQRTHTVSFASLLHNKKTHLIALSGILLSVQLSSHVFALTQIQTQLDLGETNADVTSLQQFLATTPALYPSGLVTGYFGGLTQAGVIRFQTQYGIVTSGTPSTTGFGRVGPSTIAKINSLVTNGGVVVTPSGVSPAVSLQYLPQITATTATFMWVSSNEAATGQIYYSTSPLQMNEGDINSNGFAVTTGTLASYDGIYRISQTSVITGLQPNTMYYYTIVARDASNNISVIGPNNTFRTASQ